MIASCPQALPILLGCHSLKVTRKSALSLKATEIHAKNRCWWWKNKSGHHGHTFETDGRSKKSAKMVTMDLEPETFFSTSADANELLE